MNDLILITCENSKCTKTWWQSPNVKNKFCSKLCIESYEAWQAIEQKKKVKKNHHTKSTTESSRTKTKAPIITKKSENKIEKPSELETTNITPEKIQSLESPGLLNNLKTERLGSIEQLNFVANLLLIQAEKNPDKALEALKEFRNTMKTKLDFIKFGFDLSKNENAD